MLLSCSLICKPISTSLDTATDLLLVNFEGVAVRHVKCIWTIRRLNTTSVEEKSDRIGRLSLSLAEGIHKLLQLSGPLDLEEHLVVVVGTLILRCSLAPASGFSWAPGLPLSSEPDILTVGESLKGSV